MSAPKALARQIEIEPYNAADQIVDFGDRLDRWHVELRDEEAESFFNERLGVLSRHCWDLGHAIQAWRGGRAGLDDVRKHLVGACDQACALCKQVG